MRCSPFDSGKSPLASLFQRGVLLWDHEELRIRLRKIPLFKRGIKGDFQSTLMTTVRVRLSNQ
jgi:hypothetical protein